MCKKIKILPMVGSFIVLLAFQHAQADIPSLPGAYQPAPAGTKLGLLHLQYAQADELYQRGDKVTDDLDMTLKQGIFRYLHFTSLNGMPALVEAALPIARQETGLTDTSLSGIGDAFFGGILWPYSDRTLGRHAAVALRATAPTGEHKGEGFGASNDRWAYDLQTAYVHRLGDSKWYAEAVAELELYTDTRKNNIETDPLYQIYANVRYDLSSRSSLSLQYRHKWGAEQYQGGDRLHDGLNNNSVGVVWAGFVTNKLHLLGHVQQDVDVEQGPKMTIFHARIGYLF